MLLGQIAAIAGALPMAEALAFLAQCGDLLEAAVAAGEPAPGVVLGPLPARYGTALKDTGTRGMGAS